MNFWNTCTTSLRLKNIRVHSYRPSAFLFVGNIYIIILYYYYFVNYGKDIVATEALVFMLVGLRSTWKYPIGYVLSDKISASNLHCLISRALDHASKHDLDVHSVTLDGAAFNLGAMQIFGYKLGYSAHVNDG